ncbi:c-type cytochrome [Maricaulis salignorans]|uniref:c-type cytochrome n=1 Tax=Maricaulis salignorans TaxID=144026 RepID=UPI003A8EC6B2
MSRILLPVLASLALLACSDGADPAASGGTSAAAQSVSADLTAPDAAPVEQAVALATSGPDLANGQRQFRRCQSCHTLNEGGRHTVGPNLHDVIGHPAASAAGFSYSRALREAGLTWDLETLDAWIENPRELVPGNRMSFVGLRNAQDRRDVIAYMATTTAQGD